MPNDNLYFVTCTSQIRRDAGHRFDFDRESRTEKPCADDMAEDGCPGDSALERHGSDGYELCVLRAVEDSSETSVPSVSVEQEAPSLRTGEDVTHSTVAGPQAHAVISTRQVSLDVLTQYVENQRE
jgi:hypothetical protein